tara:strand:- start:10291 stop:10722 length:432 start_codon:yes stop_codon:yes gene_type:complete
MFELTYRSVASSSISEKDILEILNEAKTFNFQNNITGCLVFYDNHFIQILEGDENIIKQIFSKIVIDSRHSNVQVLSEGIKKERFFPDWNMAYSDMNETLEVNVEVKNYANNLLLLSEFIDKPTTTLKMFWAGINRLIANPAI